MNRQAGYVSLPMLFFLLMLMAVALGAAAFVGQIRRPLADLDGQERHLRLFGDALAAFRQAYDGDKTPESDAPGDPVFAMNGTRIDDYTVNIEDVSSRLPLQWINLNIIENTALRACLKPGATIQSLSDKREEAGYSYDLAGCYGELVTKQALKRWFTPYGWASLNVGAEEVLTDLYQFRTGGDGLEFRSKIRQKFMAKELWTTDDQALALGAGADQAYPLINALPLMNVNFAPPEIIAAVVGYPFPDGAIENGPGVAAGMVAARDGGAVGPDQLKAMVPIKKPQQNRVFSYLGCRTWFWKIGLAGPDGKFFLIVAIEPPPGKPIGAGDRGKTVLLRAGAEPPEADPSSAADGE